jgi:serine phosphatase RsbU (regulator of sigma subunit)
MSIMQGVLGLRVSFNEGRFGFKYKVTEDGSGMEIINLVDNYPAQLAGLQEGDRIVSVNGKPLNSENSDNIWGEALAGTRMEITFMRGEQEMTVNMTRKLLNIFDRVLRVLYLLILPLLMLAYVLVGLWGITKYPSFITNLIALVCFSFGLMISNVNLTTVMSPLTEYFHYYELRAILMPIGLMTAPAFWLLLFVNFPQKSNFYKKHKLLSIALIFFFPILLFAIFLLFPILMKYFWGNLFYMILTAIYIFWGIAILAKGARSVTNILKKRQYQLILFGIKYGALAIFVGYCCLGVYSALQHNLPEYFGWLTFLFFLITQVIGMILPFTFLNSFFHHKILETESAMRRKLRHLAATSGLFLLYLLFAFFLNNWIITGLELKDPTLIVLIVLVLSLTFSPLHSWMLRWLEETLYPEKTKYKNALKELIKRMSSYIEESQILENLTAWLSDTMNIAPIYAVSIERAKILKIPINVHSKKSVMARIKDGSSFFWDEMLDETDKPMEIDEAEKSWALQKGISITVPMISHGEPVGILSLGKKKNNEDFTGDDLEIFHEAAYHAAVAIQNIKLQSEHLEKKRIEKELEVARNIQNQLMPREIPAIEGLQLHGEYKPCFEVGGDYFDIIPVGSSKTALVIADVSGKGAGAALLMSNLQASLKMAISMDIALEEMVYKINNIIVENSLVSQFITFFVGIWDNGEKMLRYVNAGHNPPLIVSPNNKVKKLSPTGIALGIKENQVHKSEEVLLSPGDLAIIYTDGIEEFFNYRLEEYGIDRMVKVFKENRARHPREMIISLFQDLKKFSEGQKAYHCDDLTIIAAKRID